jgi:translation initiation factor IF-3
MTRINDRIRVPQVRVIDADGSQVGVITRDEALEKARMRDLDLVEVSPNAHPPVCKIMDYGKYKYEQSKREKDSKKKQHVIQVKEIRLRPRIDKHDFEFKLKNAIKFLDEGNKVKVTLLFRGREMAHRDLGYEVMKEVEEYLDDIGKPEAPVRAEGRTLVSYYHKKKD